MLTITIPEAEYYDELIEEFVYIDKRTLQLEHSLVSISKWESKWKKPFLSKIKMTTEEIYDYVRCMTITQNVDPKIYRYLTDENIDQVREYIEDPMTATWFGGNPQKGNKKIITSEVIYYQMIALNIPFECQKWHLNRLLTLIRVCNEENKPPGKKTPLNELYAQRTALNEARKKQLNTKG